ncbi:deoxyribonuclease IV [Haploplasma modicum]|uniref:deoxyribonuclease IV n=1 Tax=Haploplasma modicum TaxID=2150 RepID=UPI00214BF527|nr:deoxyribonuclease IV [Haploplasma modicum]
MVKIGSHVSMSGTEMFLGSVKEALSYNANCLMIYTGAPQNTIRKSIDALRIKEAEELMKEHNLLLENVVVHAPYIINLANPDQEKRDFAVSFLTKEVERTDKIGAGQIVLHPGSAVGLDRKQAIKWIAEGVNQVINNTKESKVKIALETMAGKGNEVGRTFEEIAEIISLIDDKTRVSVCFDTCHVHDAGYDLKGNFNQVFDEFDKIVGLDKISVVHVNDSKNVMGAKKDRHENLGFGEIGFDVLTDIIYSERLVNIPKILETPYVLKKPPYKFEIEMIKERKFDKDLQDKIANS